MSTDGRHREGVAHGEYIRGWKDRQSTKSACECEGKCGCQCVCVGVGVGFVGAVGSGGGQTYESVSE